MPPVDPIPPRPSPTAGPTPSDALRNDGQGGGGGAYMGRKPKEPEPEEKEAPEEDDAHLDADSMAMRRRGGLSLENFLNDKLPWEVDEEEAPAEEPAPRSSGPLRPPGPKRGGPIARPTLPPAALLSGQQGRQVDGAFDATTAVNSAMAAWQTQADRQAALEQAAAAEEARAQQRPPSPLTGPLLGRSAVVPQAPDAGEAARLRPIPPKPIIGEAPVTGTGKLRPPIPPRPEPVVRAPLPPRPEPAQPEAARAVPPEVPRPTQEGLRVVPPEVPRPVQEGLRVVPPEVPRPGQEGARPPELPRPAQEAARVVPPEVPRPAAPMEASRGQPPGTGALQLPDAPRVAPPDAPRPGTGALQDPGHLLRGSNTPVPRLNVPNVPPPSPEAPKPDLAARAEALMRRPEPGRPQPPKGPTPRDTAAGRKLELPKIAPSWMAPADEAPRPPAGKSRAVLTVKVVEAGTGRPLSSARLELEPVLDDMLPVLNGQADAAGFWNEGAVMPGRYRVTARSPGFVPAARECELLAGVAEEVTLQMSKP